MFFVAVVVVGKFYYGNLCKIVFQLKGLFHNQRNCESFYNQTHTVQKSKHNFMLML